MKKHEVIGEKHCWVCGSALPLEKIPEGCTIDCVENLTKYGTMSGTNGETGWLCGEHFLLWYDRQRTACRVPVSK